MCEHEARGFGPRGQAFHGYVEQNFELDGHETELLREACRTLDTLDRLESAVAADGAIVEGSTGQPRVHPAMQEARVQRLALAKILKQLALPSEEDARPESFNTTRARKAANARWGNRGTA